MSTKTLIASLSDDKGQPMTNAQESLEIKEAASPLAAAPAPPSWWTPWRIAFFVLLVATCFFTRFYDLGTRPIMHDESLFVYYTEFQLHRELSYKYMPILHGPAMLHIQALVFHIFGVSDYTMRIGVAALGFFGLFWIWALRRWLGNVGIWVAMAFYVFSPALMFYQRFYRNDALFAFTTLWIFASAVRWWHSRDARWAASFILACTILFCNKESSLFIYFTAITFFVMLIVHDLAAWLLRDKSTNRVVEKPPFIHPAIGAGIVFVFVTLVLTRVFEGIAYEASVVRAIGKDFVLKDVRSIPMALGWQPAVEDVGRAGDPGTWRIFYVVLAAGSLALMVALKKAIDGGWGRSAFLSDYWGSVRKARWWILGALGLGFFLYMAIFTTYFLNTKGPFELYKDTLAYWMGQNAQHRIKGPFHMHLVNMLIYELPMMTTVLVAAIVASLRIAWNRVTPVSLFLVAVAFFGFHALFFRGSEQPMIYFLALTIGCVALGIALLLRPHWGTVLYPLGFALFLVFSAQYLGSTEMDTYLTEPHVVDGVQIDPSGRVHLDETLSLEHPFHLFLIAFLVLGGTVLTWHKIDRGERFHGLAIWWLITNIGAVSYAREKVPWVGIHLALPLVFLTGLWAQKWAVRLAEKKGTWRGVSVGQTVAMALLAVALLWQSKAAFQLCFRNHWDIRERLIFSMTPDDLKHHADMVQRYAEVAGIRTTPHHFQGTTNNPTVAEWLAFYNDPKREKDVQILVKAEATTWPLMWYLRDLDYTQWVDPKTAVEQDYEFLFLEAAQENNVPGLKDKYHVIKGRARMFWTPKVLEWDKLVDAWKLLIPGHYLNTSPQRAEADAAKQEWDKLKNYVLHRHTFDRNDAYWPTVSSQGDYLFCIHKDLPPF
ncbi:MAG: glycosyltransferase family 39 protein [Sumerlaeia bacterium]